MFWRMCSSTSFKLLLGCGKELPSSWFTQITALGSTWNCASAEFLQFDYYSGLHLPKSKTVTWLIPLINVTGSLSLYWSICSAHYLPSTEYQALQNNLTNYISFVLFLFLFVLFLFQRQFSELLTVTYVSMQVRNVYLLWRKCLCFPKCICFVELEHASIWYYFMVYAVIKIYLFIFIYNNLGLFITLSNLIHDSDWPIRAYDTVPALTWEKGL